MSAPASMPIPTVDCQFRMGPSFVADVGEDYWWNYRWPDGTITAAAEPVGWESVTYVTPLDQVGGRDGALTGPQSVGPRSLEIEALIVAPTAALLRQHIARVRALLGPQGLPGPRLPIVWEQHDFGTNRRLALVVRPIGDFTPVVVPGFTEGGLASAMRFSLVAATPWKYESGASVFAQMGLQDPALVGGRTYNRTFDYTYGGSSGAGGTLVVVNNGDLPTWPTFTITGPVDFPVITNATSGLTFQVNKNLSATDVVIIDSTIGTVSPASVRLIGRPFPLVPGSNTITWRAASGTYYPAARLRLDWRSTSL